MYYNETEKEREEKRAQVLKDITTFIISNMAYTKYLETLGNKNEVPVFCDVQTLKLIYASFMLMLWKDEYIMKDSNKMLNSNLSDELLDEIISYIATKQADGSWKIGNITLDNSYEVIQIIKNKIAHGDYKIENNNIELKYGNKSGYINIDDLIDFSNELGTSWESIKATGENKRIFIGSNIPQKLLNKKISNNRDLEKYLKYLNYIEITDRPFPGYERNKDYVEIVDEFTESIIKNNNQDHADGYKEIIMTYYKLMEKMGIDISITSTNSYFLPNINEVLESFKKNKTFYKEEDILKQINYLSYTLYEKNTVSAQKKNISEGIILNQGFLHELSNNPNKSMTELLDIKDKISLAERSKLDKAILTSYLVGFYVVYIYGLNRIYTADERDHIDKLYDQSIFDFSKLDLSNINYKTLEISKNFDAFQDQYNKKKKKMEELQNRYMNVDEIANSLEERIEKERQSSKKDISSLIKGLKKTRNDLLEINEKYWANKPKFEFETNFINNNFEDYKKNRAIIEHIRNSISHGNVQLNYAKGYGKRDDATICFKDIYDGKVGFEAELTVDEFSTLISGKNLKTIASYIHTNFQNCDEITNNNIDTPKQYTLG